MRMRAIVPKESGGLVEDLTAKARRYAYASMTEATRRAYRDDFRKFTEWCEAHGRASLPASFETIALFLAARADKCRPGYLCRTLTAIGHVHRAAGLPFDRSRLDRIMEGIRRTYGFPSRQAAGITIEELRALVVALSHTLRGARDRMVLSLGFAAALRPSELVGLDIGRAGPGSTGLVEITEKGLRLTLRPTQVIDPCVVKAVPRGGNPCPVEALERWLALAQINEGAILRRFRRGRVCQGRLSAGVVSRIIKDAVYAQAVHAGIDPNTAREKASRYSGHSLRMGFVASAVRAGASSESIARHVGWKSTHMIGQYRRRCGVFHKHPVERVLASG
jgi:integrase